MCEQFKLFVLRLFDATYLDRSMLSKIIRCSLFYQRLILVRSVSKTHQPSTFEEKWATIFANANDNGYLPKIKSDQKQDKPFTMLFPPPNVTGSLHLGHALTTSVHDSVLRWNIMQGQRQVRCVPGYDHAGIATQVIVEKHLAPKTREQLGRAKFVEECYKWSSKYRQTIENQLKRLGPLFDWSNAYFTMDQTHRDFVSDSFIKLYDKGLIYRDRRIVNWCCQLQSVVSDIEVESKEILGREKIFIPSFGKNVEFGVLYGVAYKIIDSNTISQISVCTTRPETMLGDTAIAVHPDDERYQSLKGKFVENPFDPNDRLPIIFDETVDRTFGTGAVKVTPGHDAFDYNLSIKHQLPIRIILDNQGRISLSPNHPFHKELNGLHRYEAREKMLRILDGLDLKLYEKEQQRMNIPTCSRTGDVIEPMVKEQWFLDTNNMSRQAIEVIENNRLKFVPESMGKVWKYWLDNVRPWCLSRQLWWGHSIPMFRCWLKQKPEEPIWIAAKHIEQARQKAKERFHGSVEQQIELQQDEDVLDTWFSSGLLPMSIFMQGEQSGQYPTTLLDTGYDIMFFWVARMVMLSLNSSNELPFREVLFHGLICDPNGKKMSKSLGNIIDPMDVINGVSLSTLQKRLDESHLTQNEIQRAKKIQKTQYQNGIQAIGSDGLRLSLLSHDIFQQAIRFDPTQFDAVGRYCNKFWNAYKYVTEFALNDLNFRDEKEISFTNEQIQSFVQNRLIDRWMFNEFQQTIDRVNQAFRDYSLHTAIVELRESFLKNFCDFYIEFSKIPLKQQENIDHEAKRQIQLFLYHLMKTYLILYHPFLPSLTEELWNDLTDGKQSFLIHQLCPRTVSFDKNQHAFDDKVINIIRRISRICGFYRLNLRLPRNIEVVVDLSGIEDSNLISSIEKYLIELRTVTRMEQLCLKSCAEKKTLEKFAFQDRLNENIHLLFNVPESSEMRVLIEKLRQRLTSQIEKYRQDLDLNEKSIQFYQEQNELLTVQRERRRREIIMEDLDMSQRRFDELQRIR